MCNSAGGHLASYSSYDEQAEVEAHYLAQGALMPAYHSSYWLGLVAGQQWPSFRWLDASLAEPGPSSWSHWSVYGQPEDRQPFTVNCSGEQLRHNPAAS